MTRVLHFLVQILLYVKNAQAMGCFGICKTDADRLRFRLLIESLIEIKPKMIGARECGHSSGKRCCEILYQDRTVAMINESDVLYRLKQNLLKSLYFQEYWAKTMSPRKDRDLQLKCRVWYGDDVLDRIDWQQSFTIACHVPTYVAQAHKDFKEIEGVLLEDYSGGCAFNPEAAEEEQGLGDRDAHLIYSRSMSRAEQTQPLTVSMPQAKSGSMVCTEI